ncbi:glycoside hydrolase family 16 protein [Paludibacter sp.]|uniref:glycoside hydrolase family 16 protein n=1 Tax=Paludibacter sp. TaxID=1898105 RepID=UPI00135390E2|nr:glycoside hydrolase family 16 protein [Paludibacter sp.]MTK53407.1 glycoside hydrolase family 16 protein [Paludibacter sp.]
MKTLLCFLICLSTSTIQAFGISPYAPDFSKPKPLAGMKLVFNEEFNKNGKPDSCIWSYENGFKRNQELQWYQSDNAYCRNGCLIIEGRKESRPNPIYKEGSSDWRTSRKEIQYTSASIQTAGKKSWLFGRFEIRARIDTATGSWPAIWTLGSGREWPSCGEIDLMEFYRPQGIPTILANVAWGTDVRYKAKWNSVRKAIAPFITKDKNWPCKFHVWRMDWTKEYIKLYIDDILLNTTLLSETINPDGSNPFLQPQYLLLNLALGSNGRDPANSIFPIKYEVDYVRIYQQAQ